MKGSTKTWAIKSFYFAFFFFQQVISQWSNKNTGRRFITGSSVAVGISRGQKSCPFADAGRQSYTFINTKCFLKSPCPWIVLVTWILRGQRKQILWLPLWQQPVQAALSGYMKTLYVSIQRSVSCKIKESDTVWIRILTPPTTEHTSFHFSSLPNQAEPCPSHSSSQGGQVGNELSSGLWGAGKRNSRDYLCNFHLEMSS